METGVPAALTGTAEETLVSEPGTEWLFFLFCPHPGCHGKEGPQRASVNPWPPAEPLSSRAQETPSG